MNREIKFRAWEEVEFKMMYYLTGFVYYGEGWTGGNPRYKFIELTFGLGGMRKVDAANVALMQFIGLKDMNGKEMYESDICKIHFHHDKTSDVGVIEWMRDASFCIRGKSIYSPAFKSGGGFGDYPAVEVIGNIWENPELLKDETKS